MVNVVERRNVRIAEELVLKKDFKVKDGNGEIYSLKKGSVGYVTSYHGIILENGSILVGFKELENDGSIDKPGFAAYLYRVLEGELLLSEMLESCMVSEETFKNVILDKMNEMFLDKEEIERLGESKHRKKIDLLEIAGSLYKGFEERLPLSRMLESCMVSEEMFMQAIFNALENIIFDTEKVKGFVDLRC